MKLNLECLIPDRRTIQLLISVTNDTDNDLAFSFSNNSGALARNGIRLLDSSNNHVLPVEKMLMTPISSETDSYLLKNGTCKQFEIAGKVINESDGHLITFKGISFLLKYNNRYKIQFKFKKFTSNIVDIPPLLNV